MDDHQHKLPQLLPTEYNEAIEGEEFFQKATGLDSERFQRGPIVPYGI